MLPSLSLPPLEFCFGTSPIQAEKSRPDRNALGSPMLATRAVANAGPTPGMASSRLLVSFDRCHAMMWRSKARIWAFRGQQLSPKSSHTGPGYLGEPGVVDIDDDFEQLLDTPAPDRCDDSELGKVRPDGIDDGRLLANEQMSRAMEAQAALLLGRLVGTKRMFRR